MAAPAKNFTVILDTSVDPDSPLDTTLMTALRDNDQHLEEWLGKDYTAATNHNHDGTNSAAIETGLVAKNGSWEDGIDSGWTYADFTGGSHAIETTNHSHGANAAAITSTVLANGGGTATKNEFWTVGSEKFYPLEVYIHASTTLVSSKVELGWYDSTQTIISTATPLSLTDTPTTRTRYAFHMEAPATARFAKLVLTGGVPATGTNTGTVYFDGVSFGEFGTGWMKIASSGELASTSTVDFSLLNDCYDKYWVKFIDVDPSGTSGVYVWMRMSQDGGSTFKSGASDYLHVSNVQSSAGTTWVPSGSTGDAKIVLGVIGTTAVSMNADLFIDRPANDYSGVRWQMDNLRSNTSVELNVGVGNYSGATGGFDAIRFLTSSGSFTTGKIELWAMPK